MIKKSILIYLSLIVSMALTAQCYETLNFGGRHTIGQKSDGSLWGWGYGIAGQVLTLNEAEPNPIALGSQTDWKSVALGVFNTFVIKQDGTLWGCGSNQHGSLGVNTTTLFNPTFQQITTASNWVKVAPSKYFTLALKADGTIWAWGQNDYYQCGNSPATAQELVPLQVGTATDWVEIAAGTSRTAFAIKADGTIWGWGKNPSSIIIYGSSTQNVAFPTQVGTDNDWVTMSVGGQHILAQKTDGTLWSWGSGPSMGVGGTPAVTNTPQQISTDTWKTFSAGGSTSVGIKTNGTLWAWGDNSNGQLGDGTSITHFLPTQIGTDTDWNTVHGKYSPTTMATKTDGSVWYWGTNYYGEFGDGTSYNLNYYTTPVQTVGICVTTGCAVPSGLTATSITTTSASLGWTSTAVLWDVEWNTAGFSPTGTPTQTTSDNPYLLTNLTANTSYEYYVRAKCGVDSSAWVGPFSFTTNTIAPCPTPTLLTATNITTTSASLEWTSTAVLWDIERGISGFTPTGTPTQTTSDNPYTLNSLTSNTDYAYYVRANCSVNTSAWTGPFNFTTATVGIGEITNTLGVNIYPNPATDMVMLDYNLTIPNATLAIYDLTGRSISKNRLTSEKGVLQLNTSTYQPGMYIIVVKEAGVILYQQKLIIKH